MQKEEGRQSGPLAIRHSPRFVILTGAVTRQRWAIQRRPHLANQFSFSLLQTSGFYILQNMKLNLSPFADRFAKSYVDTTEASGIALAIVSVAPVQLHNASVVFLLDA
jgi:hypothetical protein